MTWRPSLGAIPGDAGTTFRVWATAAEAVDVEIESKIRVPLEASGHGIFAAHVPGVVAGDRYRFWVGERGPYPDPASRYQPLGVHGPSEVVDPSRFAWSDQAWHGIAIDDVVLYELHIGAFTRAGTFAAAAARLPELRDLGVTAIELMPIADFPGNRNWGYDGAALFAPARCYGAPDGLRRFVDDAHRLGLAVHLDVVYNHLGPDGAYLAAFSPRVLTQRHRTPWGDGINLDGPYSKGARNFFIESAMHWIHEFHLDGLRVDATHAMVDKGSRHFAAELATRVHESVSDRRLVLISEDARNLAHIVKPESHGGWGMEAVWVDDFHHQMRRLLAGDCDGYFAHYSGTMRDLATTIRQGWYFTGQGGPDATRGTDPTGLEPQQFVFFIQNHDQVGNRAFGERLTSDVDLATYRAASAVLLCGPHTPLLFMGQEWAARTPFLYFTDHGPEIGPSITNGRRNEFRHFKAFATPEARANIADPQDAETFARSHLDWSEREQPPHAATLRLYRALLRLRATEPALMKPARGAFDVEALDKNTLLMRRDAPDRTMLLVIARLAGSGEVEIPLPDGPWCAAGGSAATWTQVLSTEDPTFAPDPQPVEVTISDRHCRIRFARPAAVMLRSAAR